MSAWEEEIFSLETNVDFLDELNDLDDEDIVEAVRDAVFLATRQDHVSEDERDNALAAATVAAIWAGAPFSAGDVVNSYPFIRGLIGSNDEELDEKAAELLEGYDTEHDLEAFIEALS